MSKINVSGSGGDPHFSLADLGNMGGERSGINPPDLPESEWPPHRPERAVAQQLLNELGKTKTTGSIVERAAKNVMSVAPERARLHEKPGVYAMTPFTHPTTGKRIFINHTTGPFRTPITWAKLPNFFDSDEYFAELWRKGELTVEFFGASTAQSVLGFILVAWALKGEDARRIQIEVSDKHHPEQMEMAQLGILSTLSLDEPWGFEGLVATWNEMQRYTGGVELPPLSDLVDPTPLKPDKWVNFYRRNAPKVHEVEKNRENKWHSLWGRAALGERLVGLRREVHACVQEMVRFHKRPRDLIEAIRSGSRDKPRVLVVQNVLYLLTEEEMKEFFKALETVPKGSLLILGSAEFMPELNPDLFPRLERAGFEMIDGEGGYLDPNDRFPERLAQCDLPGALVKVSDAKVD